MAYMRVDTGPDATRGANPTLGPLQVVSGGVREDVPMARSAGWAQAVGNWPARGPGSARPAFMRGMGDYVPYRYYTPTPASFSGGGLGQVGRPAWLEQIFRLFTPRPTTVQPYGWSVRPTAAATTAAPAGPVPMPPTRAAGTVAPDNTSACRQGCTGALHKCMSNCAGRAVQPPALQGVCAGCGPARLGSLGQTWWPFPGIPMWPAVIGGGVLLWYLTKGGRRVLGGLGERRARGARRRARLAKAASEYEAAKAEPGFLF